MYKNFKYSLKYGCVKYGCVVSVSEYTECFVGEGEYSILKKKKARENTLILFIPKEANVHRSPYLFSMIINDYIKSHTF